MARLTASAGDPGVSVAREYAGYESLLALADKERGDAGVLGWDARRMRRLLAALGSPQRRLRCTLVAGSKGKGSTAAMLAACLQAAGRRTGLYTQPHLHRYAERIRIDGRPLPARISRAGLAAVLAAAPGPVTAFEAATAFCLYAFANAGVQEAILEVGFGGRLDATAESDPELVLLLPLEREHADILGPTRTDVARHDLALLRYGRECVLAPQPGDVAELLAQWCAEQGVKPQPLPTLDPVGERLVCLRWPGGAATLAPMALEGPFQRRNAAVAAAGAVALGCDVAAVAAGLGAVRWPGRWERLRHRPEVIADGAHTPLSAAAAREALQPLVARRGLAIVAGLFADKDARGFAAAFGGLEAAVWATEPDHPRAMPAELTAAAFAAAGLPCRVVPAAAQALRAACAAVGPRGLVLVTGSLRLVAQARACCGRVQV